MIKLTRSDERVATRHLKVRVAYRADVKDVYDITGLDRLFL